VDAGEIGGDGASIRAYGGAGVDVLGARMSGVSGTALCVGGAPGSVEIRGAHLREIGADGVRVHGASVSAQLFEIDGEGIGESGAVVNAASGAAVVISGARLRDIRGVNEARRVTSGQSAWYAFAGQFRAAISVTGSTGNVEISDIEILRAAGGAVNVSNGVRIDEAQPWNGPVFYPPSANGNVRLVGVRADNVGGNGLLVAAGDASDVFVYDVRLNNLDGFFGGVIEFVGEGSGLNWSIYVHGGNAVYVRGAHLDNAPYSRGIRVGGSAIAGSGPAAISVYDSSARNLMREGIHLTQRSPGPVTIDGVVIENVSNGTGIVAGGVRGNAIVTNVELRNVAGNGIGVTGTGGNRTIERVTAENVRGSAFFTVTTNNFGNVSISADPNAPFVGTGSIGVSTGAQPGRVDITGVTLLNSSVSTPSIFASGGQGFVYFLGGGAIRITQAADVNISNVTVDRVYARTRALTSAGSQYGEPVQVFAEEGDHFGRGIYIISHGNIAISNTAVRNIRLPEGEVRWPRQGGGIGTFPLLSPGAAIWVHRGNAAFANVTVENATGSSAVNLRAGGTTGTAAGITFTGQRAREDFTRLNTPE